MTNWTTQRDELQRVYAIEDAAADLQKRKIPMGPDAVAAAAVLLAPIHGAPVEMEELDEHDYWLAELGHKIYRPATIAGYRDLTRLLFDAGYPVAPYGDYAAYGMHNADGTRARASVVLVKPADPAAIGGDR